MGKTISVESIDEYNKMLGIETYHPLVTVCNLKDVPHREAFVTEVTWRYGVYALFLKNTKSCMMTYGHTTYDYSDGTVTSFAPGQVVHSTPIPGMDPDVVALLFHPDLIKGMSLGQHIQEYHFFSYSSNEALHMSERERQTYMDCITKIQQEIERPIDKFSRRLICQNIELLLDYCLRFYDRQFITREEDNHDVLVRFEKELNTYFNSETGVAAGLPTVKYFAEKCFLSPNYFGDLVKKETGKTPQEYIQMRVIDKAKEWLANTDEPITQIAYKLGFDYSQHFSRYFKRIVGMTPTEYRLQQAV